MPHTLGTTVAAIRSDLNRGTDIDARVQEAIVNAIKFYRARRYGFNTRRTSYLVSSERTSLSVDFIEVDSVVLQTTNRLRQLKERSSVWMDGEKTDESYTSEPVYYAIENRQIRLYPPPDQSYSIDMLGHYDLTGISLSTTDSATTNAWFDEGFELIKLHAQIEVLEVYIKGDEALAEAARLRGRETDVERELKRRANREQSSGHVQGCL